MIEPSGDRARWDARYQAAAPDEDKPPIEWLTEHAAWLPTTGRALDLATGEGRNALWLAARGLTVEAVDISGVALERLAARARERDLALTTLNADLTRPDQFAIAPGAYAAIVCTYYMGRELFPAMRAGLAPGGVLCLETFTRDHLRHNPAFPAEYTLEPGELLAAFAGAGLRVLAYRDLDFADRAIASLLARREE